MQQKYNKVQTNSKPNIRRGAASLWQTAHPEAGYALEPWSTLSTEPKDYALVNDPGKSFWDPIEPLWGS